MIYFVAVFLQKWNYDDNDSDITSMFTFIPDTYGPRNIKRCSVLGNVKLSSYNLSMKLETLCVLTGWPGLWHRYPGVWEAARFLLVAGQDRFLVDERPESSC